MIKKVLIANRGEIAIRIAQTAQRMGIKTVAIYSDADHNAPHMRACDEAIHIGPAPAAESYLVIDKIIDAMRKTDADAVHPGYGFLSENAEFAERVEREGFTFIGPTAETIRAMGSKSAAKDLMANAGVPVTPGYQGADQSLETFEREAAAVGYPILLKATAGGGGKGMRLVENVGMLADALASAQREAKSAFGDDRFLIEKYITRARHVEVQIFGDGAGNVVHMFERDCSVQRRHQKVIEEAPAPNLPDQVRKRLLSAGVDAGKAVNYRGAGTVEFLYDGADGVYFMEMNTRLQVEHPVSEMITGLDFVEWQFRIASGEGLPLAQEAIKASGHAFEARLYAEAPANNFAPSIGTLTTLHLPDELARIDSGVEENQSITPFYDPMITKIITHGTSRRDALTKMSLSLSQTRVAGLETNAAFLKAIASQESFIDGDVSTKFIDDHQDRLFPIPASGPAVWASLAIWRRQQRNQNHKDPWTNQSGFRLNQRSQEQFWIDHDGRAALFILKENSDGLIEGALTPDAAVEARREARSSITPFVFSFRGDVRADGHVRVEINGRQFTSFIAPHLAGVRVWLDGVTHDIKFSDPLSSASGQGSSEGSLSAPMPGVITMLSATPGDRVGAGEPLLVMEAMKMEHVIKAPFDGVITAFNFQPGDQVKDGDLLVVFEGTK